MTRRTSTFRSAVLAAAMAAATTVGAVALAPAASAAEAARGGSASTVGGHGHGPQVLVSEHGRRPVFYCTNERNNKRHTICQVA